MTATTQIIVGLLIAAVGACATIYGGYLAKLGFDGLSVSRSSEAPRGNRGPTLEAVDHSVIDASGSTIPGDLPFQFGRAQGNSLIAMPGVTVKKNDTDGYSVIPPAETNLSFPAPDGRFSNFSDAGLKHEAVPIADKFRQAQKEFFKAYQAVERNAKGEISDQDWQAFSYPLDTKYRVDLVPVGYALTCELLVRVKGGLKPPNRNVNMGASAMYYRQTASAGHADKVAAFIEFISENIPDR
jgi:hypothetical protein